MNKWISASTMAAIITLGGSVASAQQKDQARESNGSNDLSSSNHNLELTVGTGYVQGFGNVGSGQPALTDTGTAGGALEAGVGYRAIPQLALGVYGSGSMYGRGSQVDSPANLYSATAGIGATYHILPAASELDPWISLGSGWRGYWENDNRGTTSMHGWEIARLQFGLDYRIDKQVAIAPVVGVDMTTFFTQSTPTSNGWNSISSPTVNAFLFAGVQGRFDIPVGPNTSQVASR